MDHSKESILASFETRLGSSRDAQIKEALIMGVDGFLLDNMDADTVRLAVSIIRKTEKGNDIFIEASGGINIENIQPYLDTGINAISIGVLTHSAVSKDIRLEFIL